METGDCITVTNNIRCPVCLEEISSLKNIVTGVYETDMRIEAGEVQYVTQSFEPDADIDEYYCPECDTVLFTQESDAIEFLRGELSQLSVV